MLTLLYRTEYRHQWGSKTYYSKIGLDHLGTESSTELVKAMLEDGEIAPELKDLILERAAGNPLFMEEFTYSLKENGIIKRENDRYVLSRGISELDVPDTIQGIIAARMDRLEENLKRTMQVASVIGRDFAFRILQTITDMREELKSHLRNLQGLEFIYEKSLFPELEYIFKHALTREVAYNSLLLRRRKEIHESIGKAIEEIYTARLEEFYEILAHHYSKGDELEKSYEYLRLSGEKASKNFSNWDAIKYFKDALAVLKNQDQTEEIIREEIKVLLSMYVNYLFLGAPKESLQFIKEGEILSKKIGDEKSLADFYFAYANYYNVKGNPSLSLTYSEPTYQISKRIQDFDLMVSTAMLNTILYLNTNQLKKIVEMTPNVIAFIETQGREFDTFSTISNNPFNPYSTLCAYYGRILGYMGRFSEGYMYFEKAINKAINKQSLTAPEMNFALFLSDQGHGDLAIEHAKKCIQYCEETNTHFLQGLGWLGLGRAYHFKGEFREANDYILKGLNTQKELGVDMSLPVYYHYLSDLHCDRGDLEDALRYAEKFVELWKANYEDLGREDVTFGRILGKMDSHQFHKAEKYILQGINKLKKKEARALAAKGSFFLGELYVDFDIKENAHANLSKAEKDFQDMGMNYWLGRTHAVYAVLYTKEGDQSKAKENLNKAMEILKECGADGWVEKYEKELVALS